jgi:hypothetical protein
LTGAVGVTGATEVVGSAIGVGFEGAGLAGAPEHAINAPTIKLKIIAVTILGVISNSPLLP